MRVFLENFKTFIFYFIFWTHVCTYVNLIYLMK